MKTPLINNRIKAEKIRVIDENGVQLGIMSVQEGIRLAQERNLDLIQITEKVEPPVCKIMDYGKYIYKERKKEKDAAKGHAGRLKVIRLTFSISSHDLETKVKLSEKFLKKGYKVKVELVLKGREKALSGFARNKISQFVEALQKLTPIKVERELKKEASGFTIIISKEH